MNIYWYISKAKLDMLKDQKRGFLSGISAKLDFKLPFISGSLAGAEQSTLIDDLRRVVRSLESERKINSFDEVGTGGAPVLIRFEGPAVRHLQHDVFWFATYGSRNALLLAGSAAFAIGGSPASTVSISPSADPVSAVKAAFTQETSPTGNVGGAPFPLSSRLSYAWQELLRAEDDSSGALPKARGLAFFARAVEADKSQTGRVGKSHLTRLVIGTPLYIEQF